MKSELKCSLKGAPMSRHCGACIIMVWLGLLVLFFFFNCSLHSCLELVRQVRMWGSTRHLSTEGWRFTMSALSLPQKKACIMRCHVYTTSRPPHQWYGKHLVLGGSVSLQTTSLTHILWRKKTARTHSEILGRLPLQTSGSEVCTWCVYQNL